LLILHSCRQNKEKPVVGCHNRLFWYFTVLLHSSGQMVVKIESLISVRLASSRSSSIFRTGAGRSFKVTDLSINIAKYSKAPNDSLSFGAYSLKCVFYAGRQPRCPAEHHKVLVINLPNRSTALTCRRTEPLWFTTIIRNGIVVGNCFDVISLKTFCEMPMLQDEKFPPH
jgi:hypothetical protein